MEKELSQTEANWPNDAALAHYIAGESSPDESVSVEAWLAQSPDNAMRFQKLRDAWQLAAQPTVHRDAAEFIARLHVARHAMSSTGLKKQRGYFNEGLSRWQGYAMAACGVLAFAAWQLLQHNTTNTPKPDSFTTYTTQSGQRASLTLRDGSRVTLGPATTLRVQKAAGSNAVMSADVAGEALFSVAHAANRSFTVTSHGVTTRVLGTEFVVRAYDPSLIRVAVRDGRVSVQPVALTSPNAAIIAAGEAASVTPNSVPVIARIPDLDTEFAWAGGSLVLKDVPLGEAFVRLSRWYGLEFRVTDPELLNAKINGTFPSNFRQADMRYLALAISASATQSGSVITFKPTP